MTRRIVLIALVTLLPVSLSLAPTSAASRNSRAMWLWNADPALANPVERDALLAFCQREDIGVVWMQVSTEPVAGGTQPDSEEDLPVQTRVLKQADQWRELIQMAHARRIRIEALDGDPKYALKRYHAIPLGVVDAIIEFNRASKPAERFDGVHFDNEPYLLNGWGTPATREQILREFLELNVEAERRIKKRSDMEFGIDIPFWWQETNARTNRPHGDVAFNGKRQAASYHCIELLDNVGIMNYRNSAGGSDGMIAHGKDLLAFANKARHAHLWMGVETLTTHPVRVWFVLGTPTAPEHQSDAETPDDDEGPPGRLNGFKVRTFEDEDTRLVGIELPDGGGLDDEARAAMATLAKRFGTPARPDVRGDTESLPRRVTTALRETGEWKEIDPRPVTVEGTALPYQGLEATNVMLAKLTFAGKTLAEMNQELTVAEAAFRQFKRYSGIAIHHYETYRKKVEESTK